MHRYDAVLFDFDGVLVDSEPVHYACWREILEPFGITLDWDTYCATCIGVADRAMLQRLCGQLDPPLELERLYAEYPRKKAMFRSRMLEYCLIGADTRRLIERLSGDYKLAVVTSSGRSEVEPILDAAGVLPRFHTVVYGDDVREHKPSPEPYRAAMKRLGAQAGLVVEDSQAGVASARSAGLDVIAVPAQPDMCGLVLARLGLEQ
jgi:HAD superfamily hydrolase (TIGR01509 family)